MRDVSWPKPKEIGRNLTPSLLARVFADKLVPQDPADEPAEQLLERIRVTRKGPA